MIDEYRGMYFAVLYIIDSRAVVIHDGDIIRFGYEPRSFIFAINRNGSKRAEQAPATASSPSKVDVRLCLRVLSIHFLLIFINIQSAMPAGIPSGLNASPEKTATAPASSASPGAATATTSEPVATVSSNTTDNVAAYTSYKMSDLFTKVWLGAPSISNLSCQVPAPEVLSKDVPSPRPAGAPSGMITSKWPSSYGDASVKRHARVAAPVSMTISWGPDEADFLDLKPLVNQQQALFDKYDAVVQSAKRGVVNHGAVADMTAESIALETSIRDKRDDLVTHSKTAKASELRQIQRKITTCDELINLMDQFKRRMNKMQLGVIRPDEPDSDESEETKDDAVTQPEPVGVDSVQPEPVKSVEQPTIETPRQQEPVIVPEKPLEEPTSPVPVRPRMVNKSVGRDDDTIELPRQLSKNILEHLVAFNADLLDRMNRLTEALLTVDDDMKRFETRKPGTRAPELTNDMLEAITSKKQINLDGKDDEECLRVLQTRSKDLERSIDNAVRTLQDVHNRHVSWLNSPVSSATKSPVQPQPQPDWSKVDDSLQRINQRMNQPLPQPGRGVPMDDSGWKNECDRLNDLFRTLRTDVEGLQGDLRRRDSVKDRRSAKIRTLAAVVDDDSDKSSTTYMSELTPEAIYRDAHRPKHKHTHRHQERERETPKTSPDDRMDRHRKLSDDEKEASRVLEQRLKELEKRISKPDVVGQPQQPAPQVVRVSVRDQSVEAKLKDTKNTKEQATDAPAESPRTSLPPRSNDDDDDAIAPEPRAKGKENVNSRLAAVEISKPVEPKSRTFDEPTRSRPIEHSREEPKQRERPSYMSTGSPRRSYDDKNWRALGPSSRQQATAKTRDPNYDVHASQALTRILEEENRALAKILMNRT